MHADKVMMMTDNLKNTRKEKVYKKNNKTNGRTSRTTTEDQAHGDE
jgi:hypothetical protein